MGPGGRLGGTWPQVVACGETVGAPLAGTARKIPTPAAVAIVASASFAMRFLILDHLVRSGETGSPAVHRGANLGSESAEDEASAVIEQVVADPADDTGADVAQVGPGPSGATREAEVVGQV